MTDQQVTSLSIKKFPAPLLKALHLGAIEADMFTQDYIIHLLTQAVAKRQPKASRP